MSTSALKAGVLLAGLVCGAASGSSAQSSESSAGSSASAQNTTSRELQGSAPGVKSENGDVVFVSREERAGGTGVHQYLTRYRPTWLRYRRALLSSSTPRLLVVLNGTRWRDPGMLRDIPMTTVTQIQRLSGPAATFRYGTGYGAGASLVTTL